MRSGDAPSQPRPAAPDAQDMTALTTRMMTIADELGALAGPVATARGVREYDSDRRKRALAEQVREFLVVGDSAAAAETKGRASKKYGEMLDELQLDLTLAEKTLSEYEAKRIAWESARSALSALRAIAGNIG